MSELYYGIEVYIPEICHEAVRRGNHYECSSGCKQLNKKEQYICSLEDVFRFLFEFWGDDSL